MRVLAAATILLLSSSLLPSLAQDAEKGATANSPQTVPVQPERTPQQSDQSREQDRNRGEDVQLRRDWRTDQRYGERTNRMGENDRSRMKEPDEHTVGQDWRARREDSLDRERGYRGSERADRDGLGRGSYDEDRPRRRMKICFEYENGDEYCHYR